jgi:hypothetical protein
MRRVFMSSQKPKLVLRQMVFTVCLLIALLVFAPAFVKSQGELPRIHPDPVGKTTLASIKVDSVNTSTPGQLVEIPILIRNSVVIGGFELEIDFAFQNLTFCGVQRGDALSHMTNQRYDWEYFSYRLLPYTDTLYKLILFGQADMPDGPGHIGVPLASNSDYVSLVVMKFQPQAQCLPSGTDFFPIIFEWERSDCAENTFSDSTGNILYVSQDSLQYDTTVCPHESSIIPSIEFLDGGISTSYPPICRGDVNVNGFPYEPADFVLFQNYLFYGDSVLLLDPEQQSTNSDVNWDSFRWSIADYIHLGRVIQHDAGAITEPIGLLNGTCWLTIGKEQASPHDTVALPFEYFSTSPEEWKSLQGIALRIGYNPNELTAISMDFSGSQLENWQNVNYDIRPGEIRFFATPEFIPTSHSDSLAFPGTDTLLLGKILFVVGDVDSPSFLPVSLIPDTGIYLKSNNVAGIDQELTQMDYFQNVSGGIQIGSAPPIARGDLDLDGIVYSAHDLTVFVQFLDQGPDVFWDPEIQYPAADINADGINLTIADLVYMDRVIINDAPPIPKSFDNNPLESDKEGGIMILRTTAAHPGDIASVTLFFDNALPVTGISCKIVFDSTLLSVQNVETIGTRLESWAQVHPIIKPGSLFLHAMPNYLETPQLPSLPAGYGTLFKINFLVSDQAPVGIRIPVEFQNYPYWQLCWGHYNAFTQDGLNFIQPTTESGWIFTDLIPGDANKDGVVDVADVIYLINYLFIGGPSPDPMSLGDFNQDSQVNVADVVALINYLFVS